jgi:hypothetical protein
MPSTVIGLSEGISMGGKKGGITKLYGVAVGPSGASCLHVHKRLARAINKKKVKRRAVILQKYARKNKQFYLIR